MASSGGARSTPASRGRTAVRSRAGTASASSSRTPDQDTSRTMALRVTHCPVNLAGVGWTNVQALRRRGVEARLVVFNTQPFRPDQADWDLKRPRSGLLRQQAVQWRAFARLLPQTDIFHFYFGLTLVPKKLQFPILRAAGKKSVGHYLGSDIRGKSRSEL